MPAPMRPELVRLRGAAGSDRGRSDAASDSTTASAVQGDLAGRLEFHPLADLFPLIEGEDFDQLVADIKANGLRDQIWIYEGKILDGRNRYRACLEIGRNPRSWSREYRPSVYGDPLAFVLSRNLHRRHLTTQQRAAIAAEMATMESGARTDLAPNDARSQMSDAQAADALKVSERSVERAKKRMREDPAAHEQAKAGKLERKRPEPRMKAVAAQLAEDHTTGELQTLVEGLRGEIAASPPAEPVDVLDEGRRLAMAAMNFTDVRRAVTEWVDGIAAYDAFVRKSGIPLYKLPQEVQRETKRWRR